jgi:hypothetical protein
MVTATGVAKGISSEMVSATPVESAIAGVLLAATPVERILQMKKSGKLSVIVVAKKRYTDKVSALSVCILNLHPTIIIRVEMNFFSVPLPARNAIML